MKLKDLLYDVVASNAPDELTRDEIAQKIGKPALNHYDVKILNALTDEGRITAKKRLTGVVKEVWIYKAKE